MNTNENNAVNEALSTPYAGAVAEIGGKLKGLANLKGGLWRSIRATIGTALDAEHDAASYAKGMALALAAAEVPGGSIRSYMDTAGKLLTLVQEGKADRATVLKLSIEDARKLAPNKRKARQPEGPKADGEKKEGDTIAVPAPVAAMMVNVSASRRALLSALASAVLKLDDEALTELVELAEGTIGQSDDDAPAGTDEDAADTVAEALAA